jgi:hypothetical protein
MIYTAVSIFIILLAVLMAYYAIRILLKPTWFVACLRGLTGLSLVVIVFLLVYIAIDISTYKQLVSEKNIATIRFKQIDQQHYIATFISNHSDSKNYELYGDQWQLDSRVIIWSSIASWLGLQTGYRLDRLAGRYLSLEDERTKPRKIYALNEASSTVDVWLFLNRFDDVINFVDARYGSGVFLPMVDDGFYQISLTTKGLAARPLNQSAKEAMALWQ